MFDNDLFDRWLDSESRKALEKFENNENLSIEDKMILTLKAQTNHFEHLDIELREDMRRLDEKFERKFDEMDSKFERKFDEVYERFEKIDERFEKIDDRFEKIDKKFEDMHKEFNRLYSAINSQTWKMISAIGLIAVFIKIADNLPAIIEFFKS